MHLKNWDLEIWYELFPNKMGLFIKGFAWDENQSPTFSIDSVCGAVLAKGGATLNDALLLLSRITKFLVECIVEPWPPGSPAAQSRQS